MPHGPEMRKLIVLKMSNDAVPAQGGLADAVAFLRDPARIKAGAEAATAWAEDAVRQVREASDPNPWRHAEDEAIAAEILRVAKPRVISEEH